jgi:hypothetical protein
MGIFRSGPGPDIKCSWALSEEFLVRRGGLGMTALGVSSLN